MSGPAPVMLQLFEAAQAVESGATEEAVTRLDRLLATTAPDGAAVDRLARAFAVALKARVTGESTGLGNLYLDTHDPRDMLKAFGVLAAATPIVRFGHGASNHAVVSAIGAARRVHIIDIGLGSGMQWLHLLERLDPSTSVRLTGIDIPATGPDAAARIKQAGAMLAARASELGVDFEFAPVAALIEEVDLRALTRGADECVVVNAALALHHIPNEDGRRDQVLTRILDLKPAAFCLAEPSVEHNALPFGQRMTESIVHYLTVFDALEASLPAHQAERVTLESAFFGREILNIVVGEGGHRVERHERHQSWQARLTRIGFTPLELSWVEEPIRRELALTTPFAIEMDDPFLVLTWRQLPILAVSAWTA